LTVIDGAEKRVSQACGATIGAAVSALDFAIDRRVYDPRLR